MEPTEPPPDPPLCWCTKVSFLAHIYHIPHAARLHCNLDPRPFLPFQKGLESRPQAMWEEESGLRTRLQLCPSRTASKVVVRFSYNCSVKKM